MKCSNCKKEIDCNKNVYYLAFNEDPEQPIIYCDLCIEHS